MIFIKKFQKTVEDFICAHCNTRVTGSGYTNHCPNCLWSRHVDNNPGDRQASCHGLMKPLGLIISSKRQIIIHQCEKCQKIMKNKVQENDNQEEIIKLSKNILFNIR